MSSVFNFEQCIAAIESFGKKIYHSSFKVIPEDYEVIYRLLIYILKDAEEAGKFNLSLRKGILLSGPVGCGKTSLMNILRHFQKPEMRYSMKTCRDISFEFIQEGYTVIHKYGNRSFKNSIPKAWCFDDLGTENNLRYYGNECNVMGEILLSRYDQFIAHSMITHLTTNLSAGEIEELYGLRVRSRMREQFNLIAFSGSSRDKRI